MLCHREEQTCMLANGGEAIKRVESGELEKLYTFQNVGICKLSRFRRVED